MKKRIVTLTIALIMLIGMQVFATTGLPLTPNNGQSGVGTGTGSGSTSNPTASGTITPNPTSGNGSNTSTGTGTSSTNPTTSTGNTNNESNTASTKKPETSLPKAGTSNVVLYGVSVLSVVAIVLYRKITK